MLAQPVPERSSSPERRSFSARHGAETVRRSHGCSGRGGGLTPGAAGQQDDPGHVGRGTSRQCPGHEGRCHGGGRRLATVSVSPPVGQALLDRVRKTALAVTGDELALTRAGVVVAGPAAFRGARLDQDGRLESGSDTFRAQSVALPGFDPPVRVVATSDGSVAGDDLGCAAESVDDCRARLAARDRAVRGSARAASAAEPQPGRVGRRAGDARPAHRRSEPAWVRARTRVELERSTGEVIRARS